MPWHTSPTRWAFDSYDIATRAVRSHCVEVGEGRGSYRSIPFRCVWPAELDLTAQLVGLRLRERWDGRTGGPFTGESSRQVPVRERAGGEA